jgi:hypothetical protein
MKGKNTPSFIDINPGEYGDITAAWINSKTSLQTRSDNLMAA